MRALTGPGIMPQLRRRARRQGITVRQAELDREMEALGLFIRVARREELARERMVTEQELLAGGYLEAAGRDLEAIRPGGGPGA